MNSGITLAHTERQSGLLKVLVIAPGAVKEVLVALKHQDKE
ncbi:MAG: hypothetical protein ACPGSM_13670 [Thiolinea sp.]